MVQSLKTVNVFFLMKKEKKNDEEQSGGGVLPYMDYIGTCRGIGYGF